MIYSFIYRSLLLVAAVPFLGKVVHSTQEEGKKAWKPRVIVTTDMGADPDDQQSLVRFLLYTDDLDAEGIIPCTSMFHQKKPRLQDINRILDGYDQVDENLRIHDPDYPTADHLRSLVKPGNTAYPGNFGMGIVGEGKSSPGSELIVRSIEKVDERPIWLLAWGGTATIAQAIWDIDDRYGDDERDALLDRIRIYDIVGQDETGNWIKHTFPGIFYIRTTRLYHSVGRCGWCSGDQTVGTDEWTREHIQVGPLGKTYPDRAFKIYEGDTPSFLYLIPTGLSDPEYQWYGSWGGRFSRSETMNIELFGTKRVVPQPYEDYGMYEDVEDTWTYDGVETTNENVSMVRWKADYYHDFAERIKWSMTPDYNTVNHEPQPVLNGDASLEILRLKAPAGSTVELSAEGSKDPDGDALTFTWWIYPEASSFRYPLKGVLSDTNGVKTILSIPEKAKSEYEIHVVLIVRDEGPMPLARYRRAIVTVE